jgi:hypothetical protein
MEYEICITIHNNNVMIFDICKEDTVIRFDLNNENESIMFDKKFRASDDQIRTIISYMNSFLDHKIVYNASYLIDDGIIEQLNKIPNCEAYRIIDNRFDYMDDFEHNSYSDEEPSFLWESKRYTSMCEDD